MDTPAPAFEQLHLDATGRLDQDLPCLRCGYNLRGLAPDGSCPECGTAIGRSAHGDMLRFCDPVWVSKLARGMNYLWWGLALAICAPVVWPAIVVPTSYLGIAHEHAMVVCAAYLLFSFMLACIGIWLLTTPDPSRLESELDPSPRKAARRLMVSFVWLSAACVFVNLNSLR